MDGIWFSHDQKKKGTSSNRSGYIDSLAYSLKVGGHQKLYVLAYPMHVWCTTSIFLTTNSSMPIQ
jgi:hypothetical protein